MTCNFRLTRAGGKMGAQMNPLDSLSGTVIAGLVLTVIMVLAIMMIAGGGGA